MASPLLYAHRGASKELPENTLEAFALALELGATALETDAHLTRDGRVVLSHDPSGMRMAGVARAIRDVTLREVQAWRAGEGDVRLQIPTLDDALARFPKTFFNVDAKETRIDMMPALVRCIRNAGAESRVRIASFSATNLRRARELRYAGPIGLAPSELARMMMLPMPVARRMNIRGDAAQVPRRAWGFTFASQAAIDRLHALGVRVDFWTIDDPSEARRLLSLGADGIMTDDVRRVAAAFAAH